MESVPTHVDDLDLNEYHMGHNSEFVERLIPNSIKLKGNIEELLEKSLKKEKGVWIFTGMGEPSKNPQFHISVEKTKVGDSKKVYGVFADFYLHHKKLSNFDDPEKTITSLITASLNLNDAGAIYLSKNIAKKLVDLEEHKVTNDLETVLMFPHIANFEDICAVLFLGDVLRKENGGSMEQGLNGKQDIKEFKDLCQIYLSPSFNLHKIKPLKNLVNRLINLGCGRYFLVRPHAEISEDTMSTKISYVSNQYTKITKSLLQEELSLVYVTTYNSLLAVQDAINNQIEIIHKAIALGYPKSFEFTNPDIFNEFYDPKASEIVRDKVLFKSKKD